MSGTLEFLKRPRAVQNSCSLLLCRLLTGVAPVLTSRLSYRLRTGRKLNLVNPSLYYDKLQWLKLYWKDPMIPLCADKYEVRKYVTECGCPELLNELYGVYDNASEIDWDALPGKFVLKCNHGCGFNIICTDKSRLDTKQAARKFDRWMRIDFSRRLCEPHYAKIRRRIVCERYIETETGALPTDYKVLCLNGRPRTIAVIDGRGADIMYHFVDCGWKPLNYTVPAATPTRPLPGKPASFEAMLSYAARLSKPFPFVRVDFFDDHGKLVFGEMTFTPGGCGWNAYNDYALRTLGDMLVLPKTRWEAGRPRPDQGECAGFADRTGLKTPPSGA